MRNLFRSILPLGLAGLLCGAVLAQTRFDAKLATFKSQAAKLAAAGRYAKAVDRLGEARAALRSDRRGAVGAGPRAKVNPKYRTEVHELGTRMRAKWQKGPRTAATRRALIQEFNAARQVLAKKYPPLNPGPSASAHAAGAAKVGARYGLVDAELLELMAGYADRGGERPKAKELREQALLQKLDAYRVLGKASEAGQIAGRLLAMPPKSPDAYRHVAEYHQEGRRYSQAVAAWRRGIDELEAGRIGGDAASRTQTLSTFYRQLAFAYSKSGKPAESRQALERAQRLERGGG